MKKYYCFALFLFVPFLLNAQIDFPKFSIAGGPIFGYNIPSVTDLNNEVKKLGFSDFSTNGFVSFGGGGFIDVPFVPGLRVSGFGTGFHSSQTMEGTSLVKSVSFSFGEGGFSVEYARKISRKFDYTIGSSFGFGSLKIKFDKFNKDLQNWNTSYIENDSLWNSNHNSYSYSKFQFTMMPQIGLGYRVLPFAYLKVNAGYLFSVSGKWKLNNVLEVKNIPDGIKSDGFNVNIGLFIGIFAD